MEKNITNPKPNQTKPNQTVREQQRERNGGYGIDDEREEERLNVCLCEGEAEDQNKDAKERGVRERARNGEDGNDDEREEERLYVCV